MKKALFLDRDGIINIDHGYVHKIEDFEFIDGIFELCRLAIAKGYQIFVITNQAGIARGYYDQATFEALSQWMVNAFAEQAITIAKVYYCPHHPTKGVNEFVMSCNCRKPEPGMIIQAQQEFSLTLTESVFIGDKVSDMQAASNAGIKCRILVNSRYTDEASSEQIKGVNRVNNLEQASKFIK
ncbi:D-glycero-beta-D-manno-heptose 1,7-bisphosphate 7-phosphatase [Colwellia sp. MB02u-18]|uniref:D-glycero-beta-D-manno-heptose 1,7-bisphosphate 7-phosphatase n=1 Tax=unclassified Colwellia TaxID=196834 RepID=UPI0015F6FC31|nr:MULTISPECIES: D-glycero-beta-D-manno-heptose 1,7-bisphosphate 7-phosphatase [unclassified Colwellia]MBA6223057.1 D-glycero-beta-D-manno-heptose 1,7-bisphosphate 7-phosphatase [Colwellia sp. MB3u-45]MBA6266226.1 D-glycero-beta-D-manno-heptose 1,7-bisphosphate 7-phosphatase [Colwellia sp. MB3u-43]MBA6319702.1 D-glycero-beta-D-manno-heptose 1,7-bisphosphate 7-phosphatase [Colwellia sp. MB02u-19]MBA6324311.1 D-glycero-beta-D-manno-heptose 1,7-bisphosphate 7-phosphatase [Colwellia sp. MB02u-18]M